jgi:hypothetical protein
MAYIGTKPANQVIDSTLIADGTVTTADIADNAITTAKIAAGTIVPADLSTGAPIWDSSGNVGIGTSSPAQKLDVSSTTGNIAISVRSTFSNASASVYYGASRGWFVGADVGGGDGRFAWYDNTAGAERMRIDSSGRVTTPNQPAFRATRNDTSQSLSSNTETIVQFNVAESNIGSGYNTSTYRYTAPIAGFYSFSSSFLVAKGSSTRIDIIFQKNGGNLLSAEAQGLNSGGTNTYVSNSVQCYLNANDYVTVSTRINDNGAIYAEGKFWNFSGFLIG